MERLPMRYSIAVWVIGVACFAGLGGWSAASLGTDLATASTVVGGVLLGGLLGALLVVGFLRALEPQHARSRSSATLR